MLVLVRIVQSHYKAKLVYLLILNLNFQRRNKHCPFYWEFNNTNFFDMKDQREKNVTNKGLETQMEDRAINKCCHCFISYCYPTRIAQVNAACTWRPWNVTSFYDLYSVEKFILYVYFSANVLYLLSYFTFKHFP